MTSSRQDNSKIIRFIQHFPKGSIWQSRYLCLPFTLVMASLALTHGTIEVWERLIWFALGLLSWTFAEYCLHRWLLHWQARSPAGKALLERLHVFHHDDPNDDSQVCMPLLMQVPIWCLLFLMLNLMGGTQASLIYTCGFALMMVIYDITHYSTHYMPPTNRLLKTLRANHMSHHFSNSTRKFGVTTTIWDRVFGTH